MKTTAPLLSISALAVALILAPPAFAEEEDMTEAEAQEYAQELLEPEEDRDGLSHIRDDEQKEHGYKEEDSDERDARDDDDQPTEETN